LIEQGLADGVLTERQLDRVIGRSPAKRHGLVNRAMQSAELIRLQRGLYVLADRFRRAPPLNQTLSTILPNCRLLSM
jgi:hypothetical protein